MTDSAGPQPPFHYSADGYPPLPAQPVPPPQPVFPAQPPANSGPLPMVAPSGPLPIPPQPATSGPMPVGQTFQSLPPTPRATAGRGLTITLVVLVLVFLAGSVTMGTLYFTARSHLDSTTQQLTATKNTLATVQGQLTQTKSDNQSLNTQKTSLSNQIASMTPCATSAKALADLLANDLKTNANPFLDPAIVNPMSDEIRDCQ